LFLVVLAAANLLISLIMINITVTIAETDISTAQSVICCFTSTR